MFISECDTYLDDGYAKKYPHIQHHHQSHMAVPQTTTTLFNPLFTSQQYFDGGYS